MLVIFVSAFPPVTTSVLRTLNLVVLAKLCLLLLFSQSLLSVQISSHAPVPLSFLVGGHGVAAKTQLLKVILSIVNTRVRGPFYQRVGLSPGFTCRNGTVGFSVEWSHQLF